MLPCIRTAVAATALLTLRVGLLRVHRRSPSAFTESRQRDRRRPDAVVRDRAPAAFRIRAVIPARNPAPARSNSGEGNFNRARRAPSALSLFPPFSFFLFTPLF